MIADQILMICGLISRWLYLAVVFAPVLAVAGPLYEVELEWAEVEEATAYEISFRPKQKGKKPFVFKLKEPNIQAQLPAGQYSFRIRSYDHREVPGEWSDRQDFQILLHAPAGLVPRDKKKVIGKSTEKHEVNFSWGPIDGVERYIVEVQGSDEKTLYKEQVSENSFQEELSVASSYRWRVSGVDESGKSGEPSEWSRFQVTGGKLDKVRVNSPESMVLTRLDWRKVPKAKVYRYQIHYQKNGKWKKVKSGKTKKLTTKWSPARPSGKYRFRIFATASKYEKSEVSQIEFETRGGLRSPAAIEKALLQESLEKSSSFYMLSSYYLSTVEYQSQNFEQNGDEVFKISSISGNLLAGLGYRPRGSRFGIRAMADIGGILTDFGIRNFFGAELHAGWKYRTFGVSTLDLSAGLYTKEMPDVITDDSSEISDVTSLRISGLHLGGRYWHPFSNKWGVLATGRLYLPMILSAEVNNGLVLTPGLMAGLSLSYRYSKRIQFFAGAAFKAEVVSYSARSFDSIGSGLAEEGDVSSVTSSGTYLNLGLEWDF